MMIRKIIFAILVICTACCGFFYLVSCASPLFVIGNKTYHVSSNIVFLLSLLNVIVLILYSCFDFRYSKDYYDEMAGRYHEVYVDYENLIDQGYRLKDKQYYLQKTDFYLQKSKAVRMNPKVTKSERKTVDKKIKKRQRELNKL